MKVKRCLSDSTFEKNKRNRIKRKHLNTFCCIILLIDMGILSKLGALFVILVIVAILLYLYDRPLFLSLLSFMYSTVSKQNTTTSSSSSTTNGIITNVTPYYENATVKSDLAQIEKVIPANEIKAVRTFVNPSTNFTTQLESYNDFGFGNTNNTFVYYNGIYAPSGLFATGDIYNNGTFTNYMPWLQGKIVYVQFATGGIGKNPQLKYESLPYLVSRVYKGSGNKFYYNFIHDFGDANSVIDNFTPTLAQGYNLTDEALGFFYNGTEYIVGR